jgi:tRNA G10  N-methylase Trm11
LQEAALLGFQKLYGADIDPRAITRTQANMEWLQQHKEVEGVVTLQHSPIEKLNPRDYPDVRSIVTEIDLGPALLRAPDQPQAQAFADKASKLVGHLLAFVANVRSAERLVVAVPYWPLGQIDMLIDVVIPKKLSQVPLPALARFYKNEISERGGMFYVRSKQFVGREILVFEKSE